MNDSKGEQWDFFARNVTSTLDRAGVRKVAALNRIKRSIAKIEAELIPARPCFFMTMPSYSAVGTWDGAWTGFTGTSTTGEDVRIAKHFKFNNSLLGRGFNHCWAEAIHAYEIGEATHFAMMHGDVCPEPHWVDSFWEEMVALDADIIAAVIPIKDGAGLTSTAMDSGEKYDPQRLTMTEVMALPETFSNDDVTAAGFNPTGGRLLVNTGLWIADLSKPWVRAVDDNGLLRCFFTIDDRVVRSDDNYTVSVAPEDWNFSRMIYKVCPDARIFATRKVHLAHMGESSFPNDSQWGEWKRDEDWYKRHGEFDGNLVRPEVVAQEASMKR